MHDILQISSIYCSHFATGGSYSGYSTKATVGYIEKNEKVKF